GASAERGVIGPDLGELLDAAEQRRLAGGVAVPLHHPPVVRVARAGHPDLVAVIDEGDALRGEEDREGVAEPFESRAAARETGLVAPGLVLAAVPLVAP